MNLYRKFAFRFGIATELLRYFATNKRWWLVPMLVILFLFGVLLVAGQSSPLAPFMYALY